VSIYIPFRNEITSGPDGDGFTEFHSANPGSPMLKLYPRCIMMSGLKIPSLAPGSPTDNSGVTGFLQFLPNHWRINHPTESFTSVNFRTPLDDLLDCCLTTSMNHFISSIIWIKQVNLPIEYSLAMFPVSINSGRLEGLAVALLPPLGLGENLHLLEGLL